MLKNYQEYKTTGIGLIILIVACICLFRQIITGTEFIMLLPTVLILFGINNNAFKKPDKK